MEEADPYLFISSQLITSIQFEAFHISQLFGLLVMLILFVISAMVSGSEVAYFSLSPNQVQILNESNRKRNLLITKLLHHPDRLLATILITNNFVNIGIVVLSAFITNSVFDFSQNPLIGLIIQVVVVTFMILFFSELLPKIYANRYPLSFARFTAYALQAFSKVFWPISSVLIRSTSLVNRRLSKKTKNISIDQLSNALELTETQLVEETDILKGIVKFGNIDVSEIMRSRVDVVAIDTSTPFNELMAVVNKSGYSRIPIYTDSFDNVQGILYIKDLLTHLDESGDYDWKDLIRPPYFVPENKKINILLKEFQTNRIHMAIVVDEYGGSSGIITLEDILEEIVGEITDESDEEEKTFQQIDANNYIFEGKTLLNDFYKVLDLDDTIFENVKGDADTLAGLILELRGEIPAKNDKISYKNFLFTVSEVDERRIIQIHVEIKQHAAKG